MPFPTVYPFVSSIVEPHAMAAGQFIGSMPMGITVHYTADRDVKRTIRSLVEKNLGYHLLIGRGGEVIQTCYLDRRVNHAGRALWRELSCNRWHASIALVSWGLVEKQGEKYRSWSGAIVPNGDVAKRGGLLWDAATEAQEEALLRAISWFVASGVDIRNVCGHDEAAIPKGRKVDPGGALSFTLEDYRTEAAP